MNATLARVQRTRTALALAAVYLIWGSTYLAMRIGLDGFPPLMMSGLRQFVAGAVLFGWLWARGVGLPSRRQWLGCGLLGFLLLVCGNGGVAVAEQWVASGLAAVMIAAVPLWAALYGGILGRWPTR